MVKYTDNERIKVLLDRVLDYGERITKEQPFAEYEKQGRLLGMFGVVCTTALEMYRMEKESKKTFLSPIQPFDYDRMITRLEELPNSLRKILANVPLFKERDYLRYPALTIDDIEEFKEKFKAFESLPQCNNGGVKKTIINIVEFAYNMYDTLFIGLTTIAQSLQKMRDDELMLGENHDMLSKRWNLMMKCYLENEWMIDKQVFQKKLNEYIRQFGHDKTTLEMFLNQLDRDATDLLSMDMLVTLNRLYLNDEDNLSYIFDHRHELKQEHITRHLCFISCRKLVEQEIEQFDLRQPAPGAEADLFTCRAAKELAEQLIPVIKDRVVFHYSYQYAAWVKALMDLKMIYPNKGEQNKRNGTLIVNYIYKMFGERIDKSTLFSYISKDEEFSKIRDQYDLIISLYEQTFDERIELLRKMV